VIVEQLKLKSAGSAFLYSGHGEEKRKSECFGGLVTVGLTLGICFGGG